MAAIVNNELLPSLRGDIFVKSEQRQKNKKMNKVHLKVSAKQISLMTHFWPLFANANGTAKWSKNEKNHFMASRRIIKICNLSKSGVYSYRQQ